MTTATLPKTGRAQLARDLVQKFAGRAEGVPPLFFVAVAARRPDQLGDQHGLQTYLVPARTADEALHTCALDIDTEAAGRSVLCKRALAVPHQFDFETRWGDGWVTRDLYHIGQASDGNMWPAVAGDVPREAGNCHPRVFSMAATLVKASAGRALDVELRHVRTDHMQAAVEVMRDEISRDNPGSEILVISGRELALKPMGTLRGPAGGAVAEVKTVLRDPKTGLIAKVFREVFC